MTGADFVQGATPAARVVVVPGPEDVAAMGCVMVLDAEREAIERHGMFRIALSGGSTPRQLYRCLAASERAHFAQWQVFFGDERWVAGDHPGSNFRMAREALLDHVPIPRRQVYPVDTACGTPEKAASLYAMTLSRALAPAPGSMPVFDLVLLGLGADGHTASLFPGSSALVAEPHHSVVAARAPGVNTWRVTLTTHAINSARRVLFVVTGAEKAEALRRVIEGDGEGEGKGAPPAAAIHPRGEGSLLFVVDKAANSLARERTWPG